MGNQGRHSQRFGFDCAQRVLEVGGGVRKYTVHPQVLQAQHVCRQLQRCGAAADAKCYQRAAAAHEVSRQCERGGLSGGFNSGVCAALVGQGSRFSHNLQAIHLSSPFA